MKKKRLLVACECSGRVRDAFRRHGWDAWSCDLQPCESFDQWHYQGNLFDIIGDNWDMLIIHPPCTDLSVAGAVHFWRKKSQQKEAVLFFFKCFMQKHIPKICAENPIGILSNRMFPYTQIIQPWQFGHPVTKATCLWLKGLPLLKPQNSLYWNPMMPSFAHTEVRSAKDRSRTFKGIAEAMATQWSNLK